MADLEVIGYERVTRKKWLGKTGKHGRGWGSSGYNGNSEWGFNEVMILGYCYITGHGLGWNSFSGHLLFLWTAKRIPCSVLLLFFSLVFERNRLAYWINFSWRRLICSHRYLSNYIDVEILIPLVYVIV